MSTTYNVGGGAKREVQLWEKIDIDAPLQAGDGPTSFKVEFIRMIAGTETRVPADVLEVKTGAITVRVPPVLLGRADLFRAADGHRRECAGRG